MPESVTVGSEIPATASSTVTSKTGEPWWRTAVVYQVYIRSFADGDGDGVGDIRGLRDRVPYLKALGVDALWINPWYPSPMADAGYDVADYRVIDPVFGTLADAEALLREAIAADLRVILDIVPNHTSSEHRWFQAALAGDEQARRRYLFRPGRGPRGDQPPNDWRSQFGGSAWTRVVDGDGRAGDWYLHLFAAGQPDLDWTNPEVRDEFEDVLRFWFDRGVDGFRIDVAHGLAKHPGLPDAGDLEQGSTPVAGHPAWDQDTVHEIYRDWRRIADSYAEPRVFVAEAWVADNERLSHYLRPDELHTAFQFDLLQAPFRAAAMRGTIDDALAAAASVAASPTWVLSNHDVVRHVTRYARAQPGGKVDMVIERARFGAEPADVALGMRRARAAALLTLALPGSAYIYQGDELGLPEVEDIPARLRQDPMFAGTGGADPGRDGSRVPLPWTPEPPSYGFSPDDAHAAPWLPQPQLWSALAASAQADDAASSLSLYREALSIRRAGLAGLEPLEWIATPRDVLAFRRCGVECWINTGAADAAMPDGTVLLASGPCSEPGKLPADTAAWITAR
ncbi:MAG TPA: glycoside hydrolase family 13 protein [Nocardioidaceae bacterium]|nr:glycoside hydrolase family 13 protein [Nocardioidaceae bacterium]